MKKYKLLKEEKKEIFGKELFRIEALIDFSNVKKGNLGGYVENEENLSQDGDAWVSGKAVVSDNAREC